jgi:serine/threonine protein phosphatase PrpC
MASPSQRPAPFPPGTPLSEHYTVEGLVRLAEGRMFYLANDDRPDRPRRFCWECGSDDTPRAEGRCVSCGADLTVRRFIVSVRWDREGFEPFVDYFEKRIEHPGFASPVDMFFQGPVLCTVTPWNGEGLLLDEGAPLPLQQVMDMAQRVTGMLAFLHANGVRLSRLARGHFLVREGDRFLLFDPDIAEVTPGPMPEERRHEEVAWLGGILRRYTPVNAVRLHDFFLQTEDGAFTSPLAFGRALEQLFSDEAHEFPQGTAAMTDVGLVRSLNEDNWGWIHLGGATNLYVCADGMGGHDKGEVASQIAVETICREARARLVQLPNPNPEALEQLLEASFQAGNNGIKDYSERLRSDMGTTMVACLIHESRLALVANVGDSRGYLLRELVLHQITRDHSLVARMVEQNRITPEEARTHPHSNILLRTVGTERDVDIDIFSVELEPGDRILLCSDGLWGEVEDADIENILNHYADPRLACRELVRAAHHGGGKDNVTVVLVGAD